MQVIKSKNELTVHIIGVVNAETEFPKLELEGIDTIIFDFSKVDAMNSFGVKVWVSYIQAIPTTFIIKFRNCKRIVVDQMNMVINFKPKHVIVDSFYVPYHCPKCLKFISVLYEKEKHYKDNVVLYTDQILCDKCKIPADLDIVKAKYFHFLQH